MRGSGRGGTPIKPQRQAEGAAPAAQERAERRGHHAVAALFFKPVAEGFAAAGKHDGVAKADRVRSEAPGIVGGNLNTVLRYDALLDEMSAGRCERIGIIHELTAGERAKRRVHVVETVVGKLERHGVDSQFEP